MERVNLIRVSLSSVLIAVPMICGAQVLPCPPPSITVDAQPPVLTACLPPSATLSSQYPGDVGISGDPDVVWAENFEQGSVSSVTSRYSDVSNAGGMTLTSDTPAMSSGANSLRMQSSGSGVNSTHLFKGLANSNGGDDEWYVRYYTKYGAGGTWNHTGVWFGGYNPAISWPNPQAGTKPNGDDRFSFALEPVGSGSNIQFDFYNYWMQMHSWMASPSGSTAYYGNAVLHDTSATMPADGWTCVEMHLKLNTDLASAAGGELTLWFNDNLVQSYDEAGPLGYWIKDKFCPDTTSDASCTAYRTAGTPLVPLDLQVRTTNSLKLNYLWLQNYVTSAGVGNVWFDDVVVAKRRVGCIQ